MAASAADSTEDWHWSCVHVRLIVRIPLSKAGSRVIVHSICATSVVQLVTVLTHNANSTDLTWDLAPIVAWGVVEINLASFASTFPLSSASNHDLGEPGLLLHVVSLPMLRPIYIVYIRRGSLSIMSSRGDHMSRTGHTALPHRSTDRPRARDVDEGDSTYELTSDITRSEYECHLADGKRDGTGKIVSR